jgi:DNA-binding transcriptional regulator YiaG
MNKDKLIIIQMSTTELNELIQNSVEKTIHDSLKNLQVKSESGGEKLFTRKEVAKIYNVSYVTLREWEKHNIIPKPIRKGSRVYWQKSSIMNDLKSK